MPSCNGCEVRLSGLSNIELLPARGGASVACALDAGELPARAHAFRAAFAWLTRAERLPTGFRWTFQSAPGVERRVRELARREHACCPFLSFAVSTQGEHVIWEAHGPDGAEDVIAEFFALSEAREEPEPALVTFAWRAAARAN